MVRRYRHVGIENTRTGQRLEEGDFFKSMTYLKSGHEIRVGEGYLISIGEMGIALGIVKEEMGNVPDVDRVIILEENIKEWESADSDTLRKVRIADPMSGDCMIILTNAPAETIRKWIADYNAEQENGISTYFDNLQKKYYIKVLYDSGEDPKEVTDIVGFDETYVLYDSTKHKLEDEFKNIALRTQHS